MKLSELKPCAVCGGLLGPIWTVIRVSPALVQPRAANQVLGLAQMFNGNLGLAEVFAPNDSPVVIAMDKKEHRDCMTELHVCKECAAMKLGDLPIAIENANAGREARAE